MCGTLQVTHEPLSDTQPIVIHSGFIDICVGQCISIILSVWKPDATIPDTPVNFTGTPKSLELLLLYGVRCPVSSVLNLSIDLNSLTLAKSN